MAKPVIKPSVPNPDKSKIPSIKEDPNISKRKLYGITGSPKGCKSKFDYVHEEIIERTRKGCPVKDRVGGLIATITYTEWMRAGEEDLLNGQSTQFSVFSTRIREAEKEFRDYLRSMIVCKAPEDYKAALWLLERSDPENYKLRDKLDVKQEVEVSQKVVVEVPDNKRRKIKDDKSL